MQNASKRGVSNPGTRLCIPWYGTGELVIREIRGGSLARLYGENKTLTNAKGTLLLARHE